MPKIAPPPPAARTSASGQAKAHQPAPAQFPPGWGTWKKTSADWAVNTAALALAAEKEMIARKFR